MFEVGDQICYPMHGVGKIIAIEEREALGSIGQYYVISFIDDEIKVMVPTHKAADVGMRQIMQLDKVEDVLVVLRARAKVEDANWNRRYRMNLDKLRSGDIFDVAEVVKCLAVRDMLKGLSAGEKKMLQTARRFLLGEMRMAGAGTEDEINGEIDKALIHILEEC